MDEQPKQTRAPRSAQPPRIAASPRVALAVFLAYVVVVNGIQYASGVAYADFFASAGYAMRSAVASLAAGGAMLLAFAAWSRWNGLWRDETRLPMTRLMWVAPVAMVAFLAIRLAYRLPVGAPLGLIGAILLAGVGVGLAEELLFRGIVLTSLRAHVTSEARAMLLSSLWFGGMHLTNALLGTSLWAAALQACVAAISGATLYQFRRATGFLAAGMVVHGLWDISLFLPAGPATTATSTFELIAFGLMPIVGLISAGAVLTHGRRRRASNS
jgi:membrane protease YdiL (CAAX protease family)